MAYAHFPSISGNLADVDLAVYADLALGRDVTLNDPRVRWMVLATLSNAFWILVSAMTWRPMTWRALSINPWVQAAHALSDKNMSAARLLAGAITRPLFGSP